MSPTQTNSVTITDVVIVGTGPVGLFAIFQAGMLGMKVHAIDILSQVGGQCTELYPEKPIYDIPAHPKILAKDLVDNLKKQAHTFNPVYHLNQKVEKIEKESDKLWKIVTSSNLVLLAKVVILSAGNGAIIPNKPDIDGLLEFEKTGSIDYKVGEYDKFKNKNVAIIGGGDSAFDWANILCSIAKKVFLIHRRDTFRCMKESLNIADNFVKQKKLEYVTPYTLVCVEGKEGKINNIILNSTSGGLQRSLAADFLLMFLGLKMSYSALSDQLEYKKNKINVNPSTMQSNLEGIYAVGDASEYPNKAKLILIGFSESSLALHHAYERVFDGKKYHMQYSTNRSDIVR